MIVVLALFSAGALAADSELPCSVPLRRTDVRTMAEQSAAAIARDDALAHKRLFEELVARARCLDHPVDPDAWAALLLDEALVRKATGGDWQRPLDTALKAYPSLDVPPFLRDQFSALPRPTPTGLPVPDDAALFLDGLLIPEVPLLEGEHLVQTWRDGQLRSAFLADGAPVPAEWLVPEAKEVVEVVKEAEAFHPFAHGLVGVGIGVTVGRQMVQSPEEFLADQDQYGGVVLPATSGIVPVVDWGSVFWDASASVLVPSVRDPSDGDTHVEGPLVLPEAWVGGAAMLEDLTFGLGGGFSTVLTYEGDEPVLVWLPQPHALIGLVGERRDVELSTGVSPAALHAGLRAGGLVTDPRKATVRLGLDSHVALGWFTEGSPEQPNSRTTGESRHATALQWTLLGRLDVAWGRDR